MGTGVSDHIIVMQRVRLETNIRIRIRNLVIMGGLEEGEGITLCRALPDLFIFFILDL